MSREDNLEINSDEQVQQVKKKRRIIGLCIFGAIFVLIVIFDLYRGKQSFIPQIMFWAFIVEKSYLKYRITGRKKYLSSTLLGTIAAIMFLFMFIQKLLG